MQTRFCLGAWSIGGSNMRFNVVEVDVHNLVARDCHSRQNAGRCFNRRWFMIHCCVRGHPRLICHTLQCLSLSTDYQRHWLLLLSRCTCIVVQTLQVFVTSQLRHLLRRNVVLDQTCCHCFACTVVGLFTLYLQFQLLCTSPSCTIQACLYQLVVSCTSIHQWGCLLWSDKVENQESNILGASGYNTSWIVWLGIYPSC